MGASGWNYFVPYQDDINAALQILRQQEFDSGHYNDPDPYIRHDLSFEEWVENPDMTIDDYDAAELIEMRAEYDRFQSFAVTPPTTIEDLLWYKGTEGTSSILDIPNVAAEPTDFAVAPLTSDQLVALFGTATPTRSQVEERGVNAIDNYLDKLGRGTYECTYIMVYQDNSPAEIYFIGFSGD
jgi:hypothetical protein